jgi:Nitronate monooxygenase
MSERYATPQMRTPLLIQVGSVEEADSAAEAGVDAVIAQGIEAGGHVRGTTSIWELLPAAVAGLAPLLVLASGGIGDSAGFARALRLGAAGVSLGAHSGDSGHPFRAKADAVPAESGQAGGRAVPVVALRLSNGPAGEPGHLTG